MKALSDTGATVPTEVFSEDDEVVILSASNPTLPSLPAVEGKPLRFASGEAVTLRALPAVKPGKRARPRTYSDLFDAAVVLLMIVCAAACVYRLFWAIQP